MIIIKIVKENTLNQKKKNLDPLRNINKMTAYAIDILCLMFILSKQRKQIEYYMYLIKNFIIS